MRQIGPLPHLPVPQKRPSVLRGRSLLAEIASGTESLLTLRWRELDSNFPYAGAMNLIFAPFVSRSIVRVRPEAHPTMAMRVTRPTRLVISPKATEHTHPTLVPPAMEAIIVGTSLRKLGCTDSSPGSPGDGELCWGALALGCIGGDRSAGAGTVQCDFFCSVGLDNAQATPHFSGATSCSNSPTLPAADPLTLFGRRTLDRSCGFYVHAVFY